MPADSHQVQPAVIVRVKERRPHFTHGIDTTAVPTRTTRPENPVAVVAVERVVLVRKVRDEDSRPPVVLKLIMIIWIAPSSVNAVPDSSPSPGTSLPFILVKEVWRRIVRHEHVRLPTLLKSADATPFRKNQWDHSRQPVYSRR